MPEVNSSTPYCKYCRLELQEDTDIENDAHINCLKAIEQFKADDSQFLTQLASFYPDHEIKIYLIPALTFEKSRNFSYQKIMSLEDTLDLYRSQFSDQENFIILIVDNKNSTVALDLYNINSLPEVIFARDSLLYLSITCSEVADPLETLELDSMTNLAGLSITSFSQHPFPTIRNRSGSCKMKYLALTSLGSQPVTAVPDGIESLVDLEVMDLDFPLKEYPTSLCYLPTLRLLRISSSFTPWNLVIPNTIVNLKNLEGLQFVATTSSQSNDSAIVNSVNSIEVVNKTVERNVINLQSYLVHGFVFGFDELFIHFHPKKLLQLFLNQCHIDNPSNEMLMFINLQTLDLGFNRIREIPSWIKTYKRLQEVDLNDNLLTEFTEVLKIRSVSIINLENNNIEVFPDEVVKPRQKRYTKIILKGNKLDQVPNYPFIEL